MLKWGVTGIAALAVAARVFAGDAYDESTLDGSYRAHDVFALHGGGGEVATGLRDYDGAGRQSSLLSFATRTPLDYVISGDGEVTWSDSEIAPGKRGSIGLGGAFSVYAPTLAPNDDSQVLEGYSALRTSVADESGLRTADFKGSYSYHALLFKDKKWWNVFGAADVNGTNRIRLLRGTAAAFDQSYSVATDGSITIGGVLGKFATLFADGALAVQTPQITGGVDSLYNTGYEGLAFYLRRGTTAAPFKASDFQGSYNIVELRVKPNGASSTRLGRITAGSNGLYFGSLGGSDFKGTATFFNTGVFTLSNVADADATMGAGGDFAVVTKKNGLVNNGTGEAYLQVWLRTAGGDGTSRDADGDGVADDTEDAQGTDPDKRDTDGDGLLDNTDTRPLVADNVFTATLSETELDLVAGADDPDPMTLTLDAKDFPLFAWSITDDADWLQVVDPAGQGDVERSVVLSTSGLAPSDAPYEAHITITAPGMKTVAPLLLTVTVVPDEIGLTTTPDTLTFAMSRNGALPPSQKVHISAARAVPFEWDAATDAPWLGAAPSSGTNAGDVTVSIRANTLADSATPYSASLTASTGPSGAEEDVCSVQFRVYSDREPGVPFVAADTTQPARPALVLTGSTALVFYSDLQNFYMQPFDERVLPRESLKLDGPLGVVVGRCAATLNSVTGSALAAWEEAQSTSGVKYIAARPVNAATLVAGNSFVIATGGDAAEYPALLFDAARNHYAMAYVPRGGDTSHLSFAFFTDATSRDIAFADAAVENDPTEQLFAPALAVAPNTGDVLIAWRQNRIVEPQIGQGGVYVRIAHANGAFAVDAVLLSSDGASPGDPQVAYDAIGNRWVALWAEVPAGDDAIPRTRYLSLPLSLAPVADFREAVLDIAPTLGQSAALAFSDTGGRALTAMVDSASRLRYAFVTSGLNVILGPEYVASGGTQSLPAAAATPGGGVQWLAYVQAGNVNAVRLTPGDSDLDDDGLDDDWETQYGLDPHSAVGDNGGVGDPDGDGATNLDEQRMGTDPREADTDGDGLGDVQEDPNRDGVVDPGESSPAVLDTDADGASDAAERFLGSDPSQAASAPPTGIYSVEYSRFLAGEATDVTVHAFIASTGEYGLHLNPEGADLWNPPGGWLVTADDELDLSLPRGDHAFHLQVTPIGTILPPADHGVFRFVLGASERTAIFVCDRREGTGLARADEQALAEQYAPIVRTHTGERFLPAPADLSIALGSLRPDASTLIATSLGASGLAQQPQADAALDLPGANIEALRTAYAVAAGANPPVIYYTLTDLQGPTSASPAPPAGKVLQFYLHYFADEWARYGRAAHRHEGDWEVAQIVFDRFGAPSVVTLGQQLELASAGLANGAASAPWDDIEKDGGHPVLYAGAGGHALYFAPGSARYGGAQDIHDGLGTWMLPRIGDAQLPANTVYKNVAAYTVTRLPRLYESDAPPWLKFAGTWGQRAFPAVQGDAPAAGATDGAPGPAFIGSPNVWTDPYQWQLSATGVTVEPQTVVRLRLAEPVPGALVGLFDARGRVFRVASDDQGVYRADVPVGTYWVGLLGTADDGHETLANVFYADTGEGALLLFKAEPGVVNEWGAFALQDGHFHGVANLQQLDTDGDGLNDSVDTDIDGDGIERSNDPDAYGDGWFDDAQFPDPDGDGVPSYFDDDDDGDGTPDDVDLDRNGDTVPDVNQSPDHDGDGVPDPYDLDADNDGYTNDAEITAGTDPYLRYDSPARRICDVDGDGQVDAADAQLIINAALGRTPYLVWMDGNSDGQIRSIDIAICIEAILRSRQN